MWCATVLLCLVTSNLAYCSKWEEHSVVHDVIDNPLSEKLEVYFSESQKKADLGNVLTPTQTRKEPHLKWTSDDDTYYTILMIDPDAPSRQNPKFGEWRHWLIGNVKGSNLKQGDILTEYVSPAPPKNTGLHRYIILIYKQHNRIKFKEDFIPKTSTRTRTNFNARNFAIKYNLGQPIAGNFYQAKYDDHVPVVNSQFTD